MILNAINWPRVNLPSSTIIVPTHKTNNWDIFWRTFDVWVIEVVIIVLLNVFLMKSPYKSCHFHRLIISMFWLLTVCIPPRISTKWLCVFALASADCLNCLLNNGPPNKVRPICIGKTINAINVKIGLYIAITTI